MKLEHIGVNVTDPRALAQWYVEHLGLRIVRADSHPPYITFLAGDHGKTMIEVYSNPVGEYVDYGSMHPVTFHIAFALEDGEDMAAERERLINAGGTPAGDMPITPSGDRLTFVRDPWGNTIQLVQRGQPLQ
ncbi:MAG: VOC family protein [Ardenticatenaceae bacterium]